MRQMLPNTGVTRLGHQEYAEDETHRRHDDRIDERTAETVGRLEGCRGDERYESPAPAIADVVRHRHRGVADARREELRQEGANGSVHHAHVADENGDDDDGYRVIDRIRVRRLSEPGVERIVSERREQEASQDDRLAADFVREASKEDDARGTDQKCDTHD